MKKIFGMLSLIAILTVSFTAQASIEVDADSDAVFTIDEGVFSVDVAEATYELSPIATDVVHEVSLCFDTVEVTSAGVLTLGSTDIGGSLAEVVPIVPSIGSCPDIFALNDFNDVGVPDKPIPLSNGFINGSLDKPISKCNDTNLSEWFGTHTGKISNRTNIS